MDFLNQIKMNKYIHPSDSSWKTPRYCKWTSRTNIIRTDLIIIHKIMEGF